MENPINRYFLAVNFPKPVVHRLETIQRDLSRQYQEYRWIPPHQIHMTILFLGEQYRKEIIAMNRLLKEKVAEISEFSIQLSGIGAFPRSEKPRIIWMGISQGEEQLQVLHRIAVWAAGVAGIVLQDQSTDFNPHITLGRLKRNTKPVALLPSSDLLIPDQEVIKVSSIETVKSKLTPKGPHYDLVESFLLKKKITGDI